MKCVIPGTNLKIFGKSIHSLSKIGEEVYFEPLKEGLALRTVNASRSAYACFVFAPSFFVHYDDGSRIGGQGDTSDEEEAIKCKVGVKSCLTVFKSLATLEKTVDRCKITLNMDEARLVFQLYCRHGIVKTHNLAFIECETLQAVFSKHMTPNKLTAQSRLLCDAVVNFQTNQEEVTLCVNPEKVVLKNYVDDEPDPNKVIRTELGLDPDEFDDYQVGVDTDVTFCLKELRAILAFSEGANLPVSIHFESAGRPIVFGIDHDSTFDANFVLATLAEPSKSLPNTQQSTQNTAQNHVRPPNQPRSNHTARRPAHYMNGSTHKAQGDASIYHNRTNIANERNRRSHNTDMDTTNEQTALESTMAHTCRDDPMEGTSSTTAHVPQHSRNATSVTDNMNRTNRYPNNVQNSSSRNVSNVNDSRVNNQRLENGSGDGISPDIPVQASKQTRSMLLAAESDEEEDLVPGTPPAKKFKSLFFGLSQSSTQASQELQVNKPVVLAEASDEDD